MKQQTVAADNITEILVKIVEFTKKRQKILIRNINNIQNKTFIPKDLDADEFSDILSAALYDHQRTGWLILRDGRYTKFGANGTFQVNSLTDTNAKLLLKEKPSEYLQMQIDKLFENSINQRLAAEMLRQKQSLTTIHR